jgi:hypothetical protein
MKAVVSALEPHARQLLAALAEPATCLGLDAGGWDILVRSARAARLLGTLATRLDAAGLAAQVPAVVAAHLQAALAESRFLRQMSLRQLALIADTLQPLRLPVLALKGSAYILAGARCADGRLPRDVDLMVPKARLGEVESALRTAGWSFIKTDAYDQRYYREWSHELPPMRAPTLPLELDLHHSILPPIGRLRPDPGRLIADAVPVADARYLVLRPADQVLHAAVHLFQDSDCVGKLRDLADIDMLLREFSADGAGFWRQLTDSATAHGLGRPLWYALQFSSGWLGTPVPQAVFDDLAPFRPAAPWGAVFMSLAARALPPVHPDREPRRLRRLAGATLEFRALWLRMPPWLLAYHAASKLRRSFRAESESPTAAV